MEKKIIGYRFVGGVKVENEFTIGNIYQLAPNKTLNNKFAFINNNSIGDGFYPNNHLAFQPVYEDDDPTITDLLPYNLGIDFEKLKAAKSQLIKLLAKDKQDLDNNYILELIDYIQDYAVDNHDISRKIVFDLKEEIC